MESFHFRLNGSRFHLVAARLARGALSAKVGREAQILSPRLVGLTPHEAAMSKRCDGIFYVHEKIRGEFGYWS